MTMRIHHSAAVPEGRPPAAPVRMGIDGIEDEPTTLHLRIAQLQAAPARHLALIEGKVHMFRRISVKVIDS